MAFTFPSTKAGLSYTNWMRFDTEHLFASVFQRAWHGLSLPCFSWDRLVKKLPLSLFHLTTHHALPHLYKNMKMSRFGANVAERVQKTTLSYVSVHFLDNPGLRVRKSGLLLKLGSEIVWIAPSARFAWTSSNNWYLAVGFEGFGFHWKIYLM